MPAIRLLIFGGGSSYTHHMLYTMAQHAAAGDLAGSTVTLYDIDGDNARMMTDFGNSVARAQNLDLTIETTNSLEEGLQGSDFVLSTFRVGGLGQRYLDETIPLKYGLLGQETTGIGGVFMLARNAPTAQRLAQAMHAHCPQALLINYTNPTGMITDLSLRTAPLNTLGLCDGVVGVKGLVGALMGLEEREAMKIEALVAGVNHCTWALGLRYRGQDLYADMDRLIARAESIPIVRDTYCYAYACRLYRYYGLLPGSLYYTRYYYYLHKVLREFAAPGFEHRSQLLQKQAAVIRDHCRRQIDNPHADFLPYDPELAAHGDQAVGTIHAIACDSRHVDIVNVRNDGAVSNLPADAIVEVPAMLTRQGATPLRMGLLPDAVVGVVQMVERHCRLAVDAGMTGNRALVLQAALAHPCHRDLDAVESCLEEMFAQNASWLPRFGRAGG